MRLPSSFDPTAVHFAGCLMRMLLSEARFDGLTSTERKAMVEDGVRRIMAAGAFVRGGKLFFPHGVTAADL